MADRTIECPSCALPIDPDVEECPYCGYELPRRSSSVKLLAIVMVVLLALWLIFF
ncbi:MAG: zinc ribbon domain-containing protein [Bacteroidota bacterium]